MHVVSFGFFLPKLRPNKQGFAITEFRCENGLREKAPLLEEFLACAKKVA
jgi:hypothetical protein